MHWTTNGVCGEHHIFAFKLHCPKVTHGEYRCVHHKTHARWVVKKKCVGFKNHLNGKWKERISVLKRIFFPILCSFKTIYKLSFPILLCLLWLLSRFLALFVHFLPLSSRSRLPQERENWAFVNRFWFQPFEISFNSLQGPVSLG